MLAPSSGSVVPAFGVLAAAVDLVRGRFFNLLLANLTAAALSLPFVALLAAAVMPLRVGSMALPIIGVLLGVLPSPATAGLQHMCRRMVQREPTSAGDQWEGLRLHAPSVMVFWVISFTGTAVIAANLAVYGGSHLVVFRLLQMLWFYILLFWLAVHLYVYPLLLRQEQQRPLLVYRNAFIMMARRPLFTAVVAALWLLVLLVSVTAGPILIVGFALSAAIQQIAATRLLTLFNATSP